MIHKPIQIKHLTLSLPHKLCFADFNATIHHGNKIALMGRNGSGKSTLLAMLAHIKPVSDGSIQMPSDVVVGYVPQIINAHETHSGGERFNKALTQALSHDPNLLLLDEPTNHLDRRNRTNLMRMLRAYTGTLIVVTHDPELIRNCTDILWHIDNHKITSFSGNYDAYLKTLQTKRTHIEQQLAIFERQKKETHQQLMKEQQRAAKSKAHGEKKYAGDTIALRSAQGRGERTHNKNRKNIHETKQELTEQLAQLRMPEIIVPTFHITSGSISSRALLSVREGTVGYQPHEPVVTRILLTLQGQSRIALNGDNGSGKSTIIKAVLGDTAVYKRGDWQLPPKASIGYLDQQYSTLNAQETVIESLQALVPTWSHAELRRHLNDFLFRKNEEITMRIAHLSGGEKARLSLAHIAARTPALLILDEITNNIDLETRDHIVNVLKDYPGALLVISHDADFLEEIAIVDYYEIRDGVFQG